MQMVMMETISANGYRVGHYRELPAMNIQLEARTGGSVLRAVSAMTMIALLSGCTATAWSETVRIDSKPPMPTECAGWQRIDLKQRTTMVLLREDARLVTDIDAHNLKGRNLGCWE